MEELFKIDKKNIEFACFRDKEFSNVGLLNLQGALFKETVKQFDEVMDKIKEKNISDLVIDLSGIDNLTREGWEVLKKHYDSYDNSENKLVLIRMRPFIHDKFKEFNYDDIIPYYRTYNRALSHLSNEESDFGKENDYETGNGFSEDSFEPENDKEEEFPLEKSRALSEEIEKADQEEEFQFEDENEILDSNFQQNYRDDYLMEYEKNLKSFIIKKIFEWKEMGYDVSYLENMLGEDFQKIKQQFGTYSEKIKEAEKMRKYLDGLDERKGYDKILNLKQKLYELDKFDSLKKEYNDLIKEIRARKEHSKTPIIDYTFKNFIKGRCNEDSLDMSNHIIDRLEKFRRPIYIFGPNGSGKTHLLNAIGNKIRTEWDKRLYYINGSSFKVSLTNCIKKNQIDNFRNQILGNDVILLDDFHRICDSEDALFEFRFIYESIKEDNIKLFITSVKKPGNIDNLSSDLRSRLNDSIFLKLSNIDRDTFFNIIKIHLEGTDIEFDREILEFLYAESNGDIRKAYGFVSTLKTFYEAKKETITLEKTKNILGFTEEVEQRSDQKDIKEFAEGFKIEKDQVEEPEKKDVEDAGVEVSAEDKSSFSIPEKTIDEEFDYEEEAVEGFELLEKEEEKIKDENLQQKDNEGSVPEKEKIQEEKKDIMDSDKKEKEIEKDDIDMEDESADQQIIEEKQNAGEDKSHKDFFEEEKKELEEEEHKDSPDEPLQKKEKEILKEESINEYDSRQNDDEHVEDKSDLEDENDTEGDFEEEIISDEKEDLTENRGVEDKDKKRNEGMNTGEKNKENIEKKKTDEEKEEKEKKNKIFEDDDYDFDDDLFNVDTDEFEWDDDGNLDNDIFE